MTSLNIINLLFIIINSIPQHFVAGMISGVLIIPIMAPGERVKCLMQVIMLILLINTN